MLYLTTKPGKAVHFGEDIVLRCIRVDGKEVTIGIIAPDELGICRDLAEGQAPKSEIINSDSLLS